MAYYVNTTPLGMPNRWAKLLQTVVSSAPPPKDGFWWRSAYTSLRRNMNNDDLVDKFDLICGEVIDPRRDLIVETPELAIAA